MALVKTEGGCKVGWHFYDDYDEAVVASKEARERAVIKAYQGYDFGYCYPGSIQECKGEDGSVLWAVTVP
jgi:gamma-glutamylcyclotransferase (GGCT)/AIG2-like uncharacterized protein YtfP